jgi:DNA-binding winged helix-turn-helix (wHTH) protein
VLKTLVQGHDTVLSKEDLITAAWEGRFTSDEAIASRIKDARKALGDDGRAQKYRKTIHGVGYRFVIDVSVQRGPGERENDTALERQDTRPVIVVSPFVDAYGADPVLALTTRAPLQGRAGVDSCRDAPAFPGEREGFTRLNDEGSGRLRKMAASICRRRPGCSRPQLAPTVSLLT